jgi:hypothetical protein
MRALHRLPLLVSAACSRRAGRRAQRRRRRLEARVARWRRGVPVDVLWPEPVGGGPLDDFARRDQIWECAPFVTDAG